jgi:hypothetical protein
MSEQFYMVLWGVDSAQQIVGLVHEYMITNKEYIVSLCLSVSLYPARATGAQCYRTARSRPL